jgi:hypothetical protein
LATIFNKFSFVIKTITIMKKNALSLLLFTTITSTLLFSCKKDDATPAPTVVKQWTIVLSAKNENPALASRNETGTVSLTLRSDNSLVYALSINGLASSDVLTAAHIHVGDVITNGGVILGLNPTFAGSTASGTILNLRTSLVDSLKSDANELYFNVHPTQVGSGIVRGQLNTNIEVASDVLLSGTNETTPVTTTAIGIGTLRLTSAKKLYTKVVITNLEATDAMIAAHIHRGAAGANGAVIVPIYGSAAEFGTTKIITVDDALFASLKTDAIYFNAHSTLRPSGVVRGQIR